MKLIVLNNNLKEGLITIARSVGEGSNLPILKNVLLKTFNNKIKISATNLELAITHFISGKIIEEGGITVPFSILNGIVNSCDSERVTLEVTQNILHFKTDNYEAHIQGINEEEFPIIPKIENDKNFLSLEVEILKTNLVKTITAVQISEIRPEISGVLIDFQLTHLKLVGTDSFRLSEKQITEKEFKTNFQRGFKVIIPLKTVQEVIRVMKSGTVAMYIDPNQILFKNDDIEVISRLIDGEYVDYEQFIPKEFKVECAIQREPLLNAVKLVSNFTGRVNDIRIKTHNNKKSLEIYSANQQFGDNRYLIPAKIKGDDFEIAFNWRYLIDGLRNFETEELVLGINGEARPALLKIPHDESQVYLLMPIKG